MKLIISLFVIMVILYYYLDNKYRIDKYRTTLPLEIERDKNPKYVLSFYYGPNLSNHWLFKETMEIKVGLYFPMAKINIYDNVDTKQPYIETTLRDEKHVWSIVNDLCYEAKKEEHKEVKRELKL